jgi:hypothetical protein
MNQKKFLSGSIRQADYDPVSQQLDVVFENKTVLAYKNVPEWIFQKLSTDPSPRSFLEDNVSEEYSKCTPLDRNKSKGSSQQLRELFGD